MKSRLFGSALFLSLACASAAAIADPATAWAGLPAIHQRRIVLAATPSPQNIFSEALCNLQNVEVIEATGHLFTALPECLGKLGRTLRSIRMSNNKLSALPEAVGDLVFAESLDFSRNQLTLLPSRLFDAKKLTNLTLSSNQIKQLPESIGNATALEVLDLSRNQLAELPDSMATLTSLRILKLSNNKLTSAPRILPFLLNLTELDLSGNPLPDSEKAVIDAIFKGTGLQPQY